MTIKKLSNEENSAIAEIQEEIKKLKGNVKVLKKLYVILDVLHNIPAKEVAEKHQIGIATVYRYVNEWKDGGIENLNRKKGTGEKSKLTKEQFIILDRIIQQMDLKTAREVRYIIESVYGVTYSIRQVSRIMKKLNYTYSKPYQIYSKMPKDAKKQVEDNTKHLDIKNFRLGFMDQTYVQNQDNSQRGYCKKGVKHIKQQPTEKISLNAVGI